MKCGWTIQVVLVSYDLGQWFTWSAEILQAQF